MKSWESARIFGAIQRDPRLRAGFASYVASIIFNCCCSAVTDLSTTLYYSLFVACFFALITGWRNYLYSFQSYFLGFVSFFAVYSMKYSLMDFPLCLNLYIMAAFHYFEFFVIGISSPESLSPDSFLLNHSIAYWVAMFAGWGEYLLKNHYYPGTSVYFLIIGVLLCITGELFRKLAMWHAGTGFTHLVAFKKQKNHTLVTDGIYSICRHPAYVGFFLFSVGTQVILGNYVCSVGFAYVCIFLFFKERIFEEERYLISFFDHEYLQYQKDVPIGLPFINGYTSQE